MEFASLLKKNTALKSVLERKDTASAYMFICEDEILLNEAVTLFLASRIGGDERKTVERIERNGYVDVRYFPQDKDDKKSDRVLTEDVETLIRDVVYTPFEFDTKYYVINNANTATEPAQNKLLKTLEETPKSSCIILKCLKADEILPTIKSRCVKIEIAPYPTELIEEELSKSYTYDERFSFAIGVSRGYVGIALKSMQDDSAYKLFSIVRETFLYMKTSKELLHYSAKWIACKQNLVQLLDYAELLLSDIVLYDTKQANNIRLKGFIKDLSTLNKAGYTSEVALKILPVITEAKRKLNFNTNANSVVDGTLYSILEVKTKCQR